MSYKLSLVGIGVALFVRVAAAANIVFVSSFDNDTILKFNAQTGARLGVFVPAGSGGLDGPTGLTFGPDGNLYVSNSVQNSPVLKYDGRSGRFLSVFVTGETGGLQSPMDLVFGPDGDLYVASRYGGVFKYDGSTGAFINRFTLQPNGARALRWRDGSMFVSSHATNNVLRFNIHTGVVSPMFETFLGSPTGFDFAPDGSIYVASFSDNDVVRFDFDTGQPIAILARNTLGPEMIQFGPHGDLYVASYTGNSVSCFDPYIGTLKWTTSDPGLARPIGVAFRTRPFHPK